MTDTDALVLTARGLVAGDKGILAIDESIPTCDARFAALGIPQTAEARRTYRSWLVTAPGLGESIHGAILYDETLRQCTDDGTPFVEALRRAGIVAGIKVDAGAHALAGHAGEQVTEGLDGLRDRLMAYAALGARFAKWRAVFAVSDDLPTRGAIDTNASALARYAALCQEAGLVPIVEPEVKMDGDHTSARCAAVTEEVLRAVFAELVRQRVRLEAVLLKPAMALPGEGARANVGVDAVADATVTSLLRVVPAAVPGIVFLSGGQPGAAASAHLNAMNLRFRGRLPWPLSFSFGRALQSPALEIWRGDPRKVAAAQEALVWRARCNQAARRGAYTAAMERAGTSP